MEEYIPEIVIGIIVLVVVAIFKESCRKMWDKFINLFKNRNPLDIEIDKKSLFFHILHGGIIEAKPLHVFLRAGFTNRTLRKFSIIFSKFEFYPEKEIENFSFDIQQNFFGNTNYSKMNNKFGPEDNNVGFLCLVVKSKKDYEWSEFYDYIKKYNDMRMILKFKYRTTINFKHVKFEDKIEFFFENLVDSLKKISR